MSAARSSRPRERIAALLNCRHNEAVLCVGGLKTTSKHEKQVYIRTKQMNDEMRRARCNQIEDSFLHPTITTILLWNIKYDTNTERQASCPPPASPCASSYLPRLFPSVSSASLRDLTRSTRQQIKTATSSTKCHFTSFSPDAFTEELFRVVTFACRPPAWESKARSQKMPQFCPDQPEQWPIMCRLLNRW